MDGGGFAVRLSALSPKKLARCGVVDFHVTCHSLRTHGFKQTKRTQRDGVSSVVWNRKGDPDVRLGRKVINLIGTHVSQNSPQARRVGYVTVVEMKPCRTASRGGAQVVNPRPVKGAATSNDAVD